MEEQRISNKILRTCYNCEDVGYMRNICPKLYCKTSQVGQFAPVAYASEGNSGSRRILMSDEVFEKYHMFQLEKYHMFQ